MGLRTFLIVALALFIASCGRKAPPQPPLEKQPGTSEAKKGLPRGSGGYIVSGKQIAIYWSFPVDVDYSVIYENGKKIAETKDFSIILKGGVRKGTTFKVVGYKGDKAVAVVLIKVNR